MAVHPDPNDLKSIPPEQRKRLEEVGEAYVRRVMSMAGGLPYPLGLSATRWLAEIDEKAREVDRKANERNEAHRLEQARLNKSTQRAAWVAAIAGVGAIVVTILGTAATIYIQRADVAHSVMVRGKLTKYITLGYNIIGDQFQNKPKEEELWIAEVQRFLHSNLGDAYVERFNDTSDFGQVQDKKWELLPKITRLEQFSNELK
jgi:hypothetical protein